MTEGEYLFRRINIVEKLLVEVVLHLRAGGTGAEHPLDKPFAQAATALQGLSEQMKRDAEAPGIIIPQ